MKLHHFSSFMLILIPIILSCFSYCAGFTLDIVHRDSPESPFYNPSLAHHERVRNMFQRSSRRVNLAISSGLFPSGGEHLMEISYGTPPFKTLAIIDTGSDLSWTQCLPCVECYKEKCPLFDPKQSSTFGLVPCTSSYCISTPAYCNKTTCLYSQTYGDGAFSGGNLATETITFNSSREGVSFNGVIFGCGRFNRGEFPEEGSGIVGLGFESISLLSQEGLLFPGKFSYCLAPFELTKPGKINFGDEFSGDGDVVLTPLELNKFYFVTLDGISVANTRINNNQFLQNSSRKADNGIIIDSGTTATYLPRDLYNKFESTMKIKVNSTKTVSDPTKTFSLCYSSLEDDQIPQVTMHFMGADLDLKPLNLFVSTSNTSMCLAFIPSDDISIFGNIAQSNFWVGYDIERSFMLFKPFDCTTAM